MSKKILMNKNNDIQFQILDWNYYHVEEDEKENMREYVIRLFGRTDNNESIYVKVSGYKPYFYIEIDEKWRKDMIERMISYVKTRVAIKQDDKWVNCGNGLHEYIIEKKYKFRGFTNFKKFTFIKLIFNDLYSMQAWANFFRKKQNIPGVTKKETKFALYESNIEPYLRCMHIQNLNAVGWVKISKGKYYNIDKETCCDINISTEWTELQYVENKMIQPFVIAAFDIECTSEDGSFPQAHRDGDKIIQIGTTFSRFGESECFYQNIITLGSCDKLDGIDVIECKTEKDVLLEWTKLMRRINPDIVTGYNIFGFDYKYMKDRAMKLGIDFQFSQLSRVNNEQTIFKEKNLSSSALGKNILMYFDMTGRVNIDLMKVVQKDYKLACYKLDYVASYFIKDEVIKINCDVKKNQSRIMTKDVYGVKEDQYITIYYSDGITENKHMNGKKFKVIKFEKEKNKEKIKGEMKEIERNIIVVNDIIDTEIMGN